MAVPWVQGTAIVGVTTSLPVTLPAVLTTGNLVCVAYGWDSAIDSGTVTDPPGNIYTSIAPVIFGSETWAVAYCTNAKGGFNTVTISKTGVIRTILASVDEYRGTFTFFGSASGTATNTSPLSVAVSTANAGDLIFGAGVSLTGLGITSGAGFVQRSTTSNALVTEDQFLVVAGNATATFTTNSNDNYDGFLLDFAMAQPPPFGMPRFAITYRTW